MKNTLLIGATILGLSGAPESVDASNKKNDIKATVNTRIATIMGGGYCNSNHGTFAYQDIKAYHSDFQTMMTLRYFKEGGILEYCESPVVTYKGGAVYKNDGKKIPGANPKTFTTLDYHNNIDVIPMAYKDDDQVWDTKFREQKNIDAKTLKLGTTSGCFGQFMKDKNNLYGHNLKIIPNVSPNIQHVGTYYHDNDTKGEILNIYKDKNGFWFLSENDKKSGTIFKKLKSFKGLKEIPHNCD